MAQPAQPPSGFSLVAVGARGGYATHPLRPGAVLVGRGAGCQIHLDDPGAPEVAVRLHVGERDVALEPLHEGLLLDGKPIEAGGRYALRAGATFHVGPVLLSLHPAPPAAARRLWPHGSFEMRLEEQCARAAVREETFVLLRLRLVDPSASRQAEEILSSALRLTDVLGVYGPGEYEALLPETTPDDGGLVAQRISDRLKEAGVRGSIGSATWPAQALSADELVQVASRQTRGDGVPTSDQVTITESRALYDTIARVAPSSLPVLILGETGAGKERAAELVHRLSPRRDRPFLRLNCAALHETLLESELFGHERGAFTGAVGAKPGLLQTADTGTVFLDEVGELPPTIQAKLLRVIEERQVLRLGGLKPSGIDVRFVSATNRNLEQEVGRGGFRIDLYYRIAGVQIWVPPLRERLDELPDLAHALLSAACLREKRASVPRISADALELMRRYHWPGNVRELRNVIERAVLLVNGDAIERDHLPVEKMLASFAARRVAPGQPQNTRTGTRGTGSNPREVVAGADGRGPVAVLAANTPVPTATGGKSGNASGRGGAAESTDLKGSIRALERQRIEQALARCAGNQSAAARLLGISRRTLVSRLTEFGLPRPRQSAPGETATRGKR